MSYLMAIWRRKTEGFLGFVGKRKGLIWVIRMKKRGEIYGVQWLQPMGSNSIDTSFFH